jgi:COMPASS component SWD3
VTSGVLVHTISSALGEISSVDVDWQGRLLLASAKDNSNTLFDLRMVKPLKRFTHLANTSRNFIRSAFAHASLVVGGSEDGLVYLWDHHRNQGGTSGEDGAATSTIVAAGGTTSEEPIATLEGHKGGSCYEVRWSGGSQMLASCGDDRTVRIWV